jgi:hypothetical protein
VRSRVRGLPALLVLATVSCGTPLMKLPPGPGAPASDAADALAQATTACRAIRTLTAEIAVSGSAAGQRVRGRLSAGVAAPASARLEAVAPFGPPVFIFVAVNDDASLLLPRDDRVLEHGRPETVLDAVAGVPLDAADLHNTLTGCAPSDVLSQPLEYGPDWRMVNAHVGPDAYALYLHRERAADPWRLVTSIRAYAQGPSWRADYGDFQSGLPRSIHLTKGKDSPRNSRDLDLTLTLSQVETNVPLEADAFRVKIPPSAHPITLEELRGARPGIREN